MRGLSMSAARYALLNLEETQPHVKNWRPQILILVKSECNETVDDKRLTADDINLKHLNMIALAAQLKASRGLTVSASVIPGNFVDKVNQAKTTKQLIKSKMNEYKIRGFCDTLVAENIEQGTVDLVF
jgi:potassium/chloride transporter 4/5/6